MSDSPIPPHIRAIFFDAVDTLIVSDPPVFEVYRDAGRRHGCELNAETLTQRFREAFRIEEKIDAASGWAVSEMREHERWQHIVSRVFDQCPSVGAIFSDLWGHFARPESWRLVKSAAEVLDNLAKRGFALGLASNFDGRLNAIADGLAAMSPVRLRVVSSELGWRKPSPHFFTAVVRSAGFAAQQVLFVGDRLDTDYDGATAAGLQALLLDAQSSETTGVRRIKSLSELLANQISGAH